MTARRAGGVVFAPAGPRDEGDLRALFSAIVMDGRYKIAFERAADPLSPLGPSLSHVTMIARDEKSGAAVGVYERVTRRAFVDGAPVALPYLAGLRVAPSHRRRIALLRAGFESLRPFAREDETPYALTSIATDNVAAKRLLTAGLPGLPRYAPAGALSTLALRCLAARHSFEPPSPREAEALADFLNRCNARRQFAPVWSAGDLTRLASDGLPLEHMLIARRRGEIVGSIAVWDQTARRRTVVRAYPAHIAALRPLVNLIGPLTGAPPLPREGEPLRQATLALLAVEEDDEALFLDLLAAALDQARRRGLDVAALGLPARHHWRDAAARRRGAIEYRTDLYRVERSPGEALAPLDGRHPHPDIAFL